MSAATTTPNGSSTSLPGRTTPAGGRVTQAGVLRSEWTKLHSVRSARYSLLMAAVMTIGFGIIAALATVSRWSTLPADEKASFDPLATSLLGVNFGVLALGVLGVLLITGEYTTGMIRATMTAVPKRLPVLWGKTGVYALVALAVSIPSALIAFFAGQAILSGQNLQISFSQAGVARAVVGAGLYLALVGLFAMAIGAIARNTAAGIAAFAAIMFVIPPLVTLLPTSIASSIDPYLPSHAGSAIMTIGHQANTLSPWAGLAVLAGYVVAAVAAAAVLLARRDV
jgi:ABC-2 type transport system permease protein